MGSCGGVGGEGVTDFGGVEAGYTSVVDEEGHGGGKKGRPRREGEERERDGGEGGGEGRMGGIEVGGD